MRVCCWTERYWPSIGGIEVLVDKLLGSMTELGHDFIVVTGKDDLKSPDYEEYNGVAIHRFPFYQTTLTRDISTFATVRQRISQLHREFAPQLIHMHDVFAGAIFCSGTSTRVQATLLLTLHCDVSGLDCSGQTLFGRVLRTAQWISPPGSLHSQQTWPGRFD